ncbi:MAG: photosynthetic reaction center cytochrome c subunit [Gammaproteobacteria bacterium]|jgi:photosynthetic reaction center cytochrome c subunit|nr:photosynthetic reaction center cytochrome c subunit [Gammaproteobacteria bacterium]
MKTQIRLIGALSIALGLLVGCGERPPIDVQQIGYRGTGMEQNVNPRLREQLKAVNQIGGIQPPADASGPLAKDIYQNVQVLSDLSVGEFTRVMLSMTEWVAPEDQKNCTYCHNGENYADESKYQYKVARSMLKMTRDINTNWKSHVKQTGVTCHTCHRGGPVPQYVWYADPGSGRENAFVGTRAGQNSAVTGLGITTIGHSSLPYDPYSPFLLGDLNIRVEGPTALPTGNRRSIKQAEWTYSLMVHMSNSLGVNCTYCHNTRAWADWAQSTPQRTVAWHGIRMARGLNNQYLVPLTDVFPTNRKGPLGDVAKINCQTCHQGVYKPYFGESMAKAYPELQGVKAAPVDPNAAPAETAAPAEATAPAAAPAATPAVADKPKDSSKMAQRGGPTTIAALDAGTPGRL